MLESCVEAVDFAGVLGATGCGSQDVVGAIRTTLITYANLPDENKTMATALRLVQDAFAALQTGH